MLALGEIRAYSGGVSPFGARYGATLASGPAATLQALTRPEVIDYLKTLLLSGGWLGLLAPLSLLPALPSLALNTLSTSPWMAAGKAHYSGLVLPFVIVGAAAGLQRLRRHPALQYSAGAVLLLTSAAAYLGQGAGPLAGNYAPAAFTPHAQAARGIAASLPSNAAVSASASLIPQLTHRARAYVFPAVEDADYVFVDLQASPAPTSAGDVYLRVQSLLSSGDWRIDIQSDGLLLLQHAPTSPTPTPFSPPDSTSTMIQPPTLISAALIPSPDGAVDVDGPRWILHTIWQADQPLPPGTHLDFRVELKTGEQLDAWDLAPLWWNPPDRWPTGQPVTVDVPNIPERSFASWSATWSTP